MGRHKNGALRNCNFNLNTEIFVRYDFAKISSMSKLVQSLWYIKCHSSNVPDLSKAQAIISDATVRRSTVNREDLKLY